MKLVKYNNSYKLKKHNYSMDISIKDRSIKEIDEQLTNMNTDLNKIYFLETLLKNPRPSLDYKRYILEKISELNEGRKMYERAAKYMLQKATIEIASKEKMESYLKAAELYAMAGKLEDSEQMFLRAKRECKPEEQGRIELAKKNIFLTFAQDLENKGKKASASKFYEHLVKMKLEPAQKQIIKEKLIRTNKALGLFRDIKAIEGL